MLPEDMIVKRDSQGNTLRFIETPSGKEYLIVKPFDSGGVGKVYLAYYRDDKGQLVKYVVKEYPKPKKPSMRNQQRNIRKNLRKLIEKPVLDEKRQPLVSMVPPLEVLDFPHTGTFGYVMNYVELSDYLSVGKLLRNYPDMDIVCRMGRNISHFFMRLASAEGLCYKDINEGNIYLNTKTGDVRVIDNDNVGDPTIRTISGTGYYMAPEVLAGADPDRQTDRFSLAAFLLRMFTGARPYEGAAAVQYCRDHDQNAYDAAPVVFGSKAVFVFDPKDTSNGLRRYPIEVGLTQEDEKEKKAWQVRCVMWDHLPEEMRDAFIATFSDGAKFENRNERTTAQQWYKLFEKLEKTIVRCPKCHRRTFGTVSECFYCGKSLPQIVCKTCGRKVHRDVKICLGGNGHDPHIEPVRDTVSCPHCRAQNDAGTRVCTKCGRYITVTCRCGTKNSGAAKMCTKCGAALFKVCPSCRKSVPATESVCPGCKKAFPRDDARCAVCGRQIFPGEQKCRHCGADIGAEKAQPPAQAGHTLNLDVSVRNSDGTKRRVIQQKFPSNEVYRADRLFVGKGARPLFKLLYNPSRSVYALQNASGGAIWCKDAQDAVGQVPHGGIVELQPGVQFDFGDGMVIKIEGLRR